MALLTLGLKTILLLLFNWIDLILHPFKINTTLTIIEKKMMTRLKIFFMDFDFLCFNLFLIFKLFSIEDLINTLPILNQEKKII